jgi:hypothetical protein
MGLKTGDVRRAMLAVAIVALLAGGCDLVTTPTVSGGPGCRKLVRQDAADYRNVVKLNGITYTADRPFVGRTLRYRPSFRLAARQDGRLVVFEADTNPRARVGRDLLDLEGKVRRISINSRAGGTPELAAITDPRQAAGMVRMLLAGPVDQRVQPIGELVEAAAS